MAEARELTASALGQDRPGVEENMKEQKYSSEKSLALACVVGEQTNTTGEKPQIWKGQSRLT